MNELYKKIKNFSLRNEHYVSPLAMLMGFALDNLTLRRIDLLAENILIIVYLSVAGLSILFINVSYSDKFNHWFFEKASVFIPFILQFALGGLFSVFVVFYTRSASIITSWPFILILFVLLVGNEIFREKYTRLTFQLGIYFVAVFSYSVFAVPIFVGRIGQDVFMWGGVISLFLIGLAVLILYKFIPRQILAVKSNLFFTIIGLYILFNFLYVVKIIPPIPLSLEDDGIMHELKRVDNSYAVTYEPSEQNNIFSSIKFHWQTGTPIYYYSAIFAPTKISTNIYHRWSYFNEEKEEWEVVSKLNFPITGGRDEGYRGYSVKYNIWPGKWKVDVITENEQVLGIRKFEIIKVEKQANLVTEIK